jgi:hypothetical protein
MTSIARRQLSEHNVTISFIVFAMSAALSLEDSIQGAAIERLQWLSGCWEMRRGDRITEEQWMSPRGGVMIGMSRTVRGDSLVELEQVRIESRGGDLIYVASPLRQATAEFRGSATAGGNVSFENPGHDFPTKISYRKQGPDSLVATIEGQRSGRTRTVEYPYRRVACGSPSP